MQLSATPRPAILAADELQRVSARLQQTENVQQQILQFLQQHVSPTLLDANSHILNTRKRRATRLFLPVRHLVRATTRRVLALRAASAGGTFYSPRRTRTRTLLRSASSDCRRRGGCTCRCEQRVRCRQLPPCAHPFNC